jgi:hypothetical protein
MSVADRVTKYLHEELTTYLVRVEFQEKLLFHLDVPTTLGQDAAMRRARLAAFHHLQEGNPDDYTAFILQEEELELSQETP